jgi:hypothetical protein
MQIAHWNKTFETFCSGHYSRLTSTQRYQLIDSIATLQLIYPIMIAISLLTLAQTIILIMIDDNSLKCRLIPVINDLFIVICSIILPTIIIIRQPTINYAFVQSCKVIVELLDLCINWNILENQTCNFMLSVEKKLKQ